MSTVALRQSRSAVVWQEASYLEPDLFKLRDQRAGQQRTLHFLVSTFSDAIEHYWTPISRETLAQQFDRLTTEWRSATQYSSSVTEIAVHPAYQRIIGLGRQALSLILEELKREPDHWFWALKAITGEDPVPPEQRGRLTDMSRAWLEWGRRQGYAP